MSDNRQWKSEGQIEKKNRMMAKTTNSLLGSAMSRPLKTPYIWT